MTATLSPQDLHDTSDFRECFRAFRPLPRVRTLVWAIENIHNDQGRPYDHASYPHLGAPGGPFDAFDDPRVRTISMQFATRLGKTFGAHTMLVKTADTDPRPMMFASSVEKLAKEGTGRIYAMLHQNPRLNSLLTKTVREQKQDLVECRGCKIYVAWSRSVSTLADKNIAVGHAGEYDKWEHASTSKEAHPHKLFDDRHKDYQSVRKVIYEGTPTIKGRSPIERRRLNGWNCQYHVPCPKCNRYQVLKMDCVKWDRDAQGKSNPDVAYSTARYECPHCESQVQDYQRSWMMRRGVWCPEGCRVDDGKALAYAERCMVDAGSHDWRGWSSAEWVVDSPARNGADASYQISSLCALSLGWGDIAKEFFASKDKPQELRNFVNQWLGETWEVVERKQTWEQLGERLIVDVPYQTVPDWASKITVGIDRQKDSYPFVAMAWGDGRRGHVIDYGEGLTLEQIRSEIVEKQWTNEAGEHLQCSFSLVDSGGHTSPVGVYEACIAAIRAGVQLWPCKGSSSALDVEYKRAKLGDNTSMPGMILTMVDTARTQAWMDNVLHGLRPGDAGAMTMFSASLAEHQDILEQLLNDAAVSRLDATNNVREQWERIDTGIPNDFRDCIRYAYVAMLISTRGGSDLSKQQPSRRPAVISRGRNRPGMWS